MTITAAARTGHRPYKLLVVVPRVEIALELERSLGDAPLHVYTLTGGAELAPRAVLDLSPDMVLVHLDSLAGADRKAHQDRVEHLVRDLGEGTALVLVSDRSRSPDTDEALHRGAFAWLGHPFDAEEVQRTLARALNASPGTGGASAGGTGGPDADPGELLRYGRTLERLYMAWQPLFRAQDGALFGYEALVRSDEPTCPSAWHVLDLADRLGREAELDWHIHARSAADALAGGLEGVLMINVSVRQFMAGTLGTPRDPLLPLAARVVLEVSENGTIEDIEAVARQCARLRGLGYRVALDDLGTGPDYLARLLALEPQVFKLDRLALADCDQDARKRRYVRAIVAMAHGEGALVVAEGIERPAEAQLARELGCDLLQGFLLARPQRREHWLHAPPAAFSLPPGPSRAGDRDAA
ncbi:EAL domain-containing protein [Myxococcota bacterium]|nr:EAL domain-containing protein [Myxococcota bacterium]